MLDDRFQTVFDFPLQQAFAEHWENFIDIIHYNKNISNVRVITELSSHADVVYYAMKDFAVVKGREFLTCRTFRRIGDEIIEAARSFELPEIKRNPNKIRGEVVLAGGRFRMDPKDATKTIVDYVMCVDFKGPDIPKVIMDATIGMFIMQDADYTRKQIEKLKNEAT
uniref:START domain-containing protein n=2 Tax=Ascaris lumbricoides TaxID=6252 RepID=A0A0M3ITT0_ASCLU